jgi:hypothetical protein
MDDAFVSFDFITHFPFKYYISTWNSDEHYPEGFRYKLLSSKRKNDPFIEVIILLQEKNGFKTEMKRMDIKEEAFDRLVPIALRSLENMHCISFEEQDYSTCESSEDFEDKAIKNGWVFNDVEQ